MAKRIGLDGEQRHRVGLSLQRLIQASTELREAQLDLMFTVNSVIQDKQAYSYWIRMLAVYGLLETEDQNSQFILKVLRSAGLRPRDVMPKCDLRPCSEQQHKAIERLGGKRKDYTYSQAEEVIRNAQTKKAKDDRCRRDSKANKGRRVTVHTER